MKEQFQLQFLFKTSPRVLESKLSTPSGLSEWFADDVNSKEDRYIFTWNGMDEEAQLLLHKQNQKIRFQWLVDQEENLDNYFEFSYEVDGLTGMVSLIVTDFSEPSEMEDAKLMWEQQIQNLRRLIGA